MIRGALLAVMAMLLLCAPSLAQEQRSVLWPGPVTLIVKACPFSPDQMEPAHKAATGAQGLPKGFIPAPRDWNGRGEPESARHRSRSKAERHAEFKRLGCIDVPIPPEVLTNGDGVTPTTLTMAECMGKRGYFSAMQYLELNPTIPQKAVGEWVCKPALHLASGLSGL